jgi:putative DNA primase/helicase
MDEPADANSASQGGSRLARFSCWCPKVMAAIGRLPETLADRCILVRMQRKTALEKCERLRELDRAQAGQLRQQCARFAADHAQAIAQSKPPMPAALNDRAADLWEPLLVLADLARHGWPENGRAAAEGLNQEAGEDGAIGSLLADILLEFVSLKSPARRFSRTLVAALNQRRDRPWMQLRKGKEIDEQWLARQLAPYGIRPRTIRFESIVAKGYAEEDFTEAFRRYIPRAEMDDLRLGAGRTQPLAPSSGGSGAHLATTPGATPSLDPFGVPPSGGPG